MQGSCLTVNSIGTSVEETETTDPSRQFTSSLVQEWLHNYLHRIFLAGNMGNWAENLPRTEMSKSVHFPRWPTRIFQHGESFWLDFSFGRDSYKILSTVLSLSTPIQSNIQSIYHPFSLRSGQVTLKLTGKYTENRPKQRQTFFSTHKHSSDDNAAFG